MQRALINIAYRYVIDAAREGNFEKNVLFASYNEFLLKSQAYNIEKKFTTFKEMVENDGRANSLHYKLSFPCIPFIEGLNKKISELKDTLGKSIAFETYQFELIESNITNFSAHKVAVTYTTGLITLVEIIGDYMVLTTGDKSTDIVNLNIIEDTFTVKMAENLSLCTYKAF